MSDKVQFCITAEVGVRARGSLDKEELASLISGGCPRGSGKRFRQPGARTGGRR
jgi:hypothetical protein